MDILVTTPKSEVATAGKEGKAIEEEGGYWFRVYHFRPQVQRGDRIFFVENSIIRGCGVIFDIEQIMQGMRCEVTGRVWGRVGDWVIKYKDWHWLKSPVSFRGFRGIRYIERIPELRKKLGEALNQHNSS